MPTKGWKKWILYEFEGRKHQDNKQLGESLRYLKRMGTPANEIKVIKKGSKFQVFYKAHSVTELDRERRKYYLPHVRRDWLHGER